MPALLPPTNVTYADPKATDTTLVVNWADRNAAAGTPAANYEFQVSVVTQDAFQPVSPAITKSVAPPGLTATLTIGTGKGAVPTDFTAGPQKCTVQVVASPTAAGTAAGLTTSAPVYRPFWHAAVGVDVQVGSKTFHLTNPAGGTGVYELVTQNNTVTVSYTNDIVQFVNGLGKNVPALPTHWPNGSIIDPTFGFTVSKLVFDTVNNFFSVSITFPVDYTVFEGLKIQKVSLDIVRGDGGNNV